MEKVKGENSHPVSTFSVPCNGEYLLIDDESDEEILFPCHVGCDLHPSSCFSAEQVAEMLGFPLPTHENKVTLPEPSASTPLQGPGVLRGVRFKEKKDKKNTQTRRAMKNRIPQQEQFERERKTHIRPKKALRASDLRDDDDYRR